MRGGGISHHAPSAVWGQVKGGPPLDCSAAVHSAGTLKRNNHPTTTSDWSIYASSGQTSLDEHVVAV